MVADRDLEESGCGMSEVTIPVSQQSLGEMSKTMKNLRHSSRSPTRHLDRVPPEYKCGALPL
jgi:hypothetical protein